MRKRPSITRRLASWYAAIVLAVGALLLAFSFVVVRHEFPPEPEAVRFSLPAPAPSPPDGGRSPDVLLGPDRQPIPVENVRALEKRVAAAQAEANREALKRVLLYFAGALGALALLAIGVGTVVARRAMAPVAAITHHARSVSAGNLGERLALEGPRDELRELADTFDDMLGKLDDAFGREQRFVANASHELRTPLATIGTALDVLLANPDASPQERDHAIRLARDAVERSEKLIDRLLTLARGGGELVHEELDLGDAVRSARRELAVPADVTVEEHLAPAPVRGDRVLLERIAANLLENAARYNRPNGTISAATGRHNGHAWLEVSNDGPRVDPADVELLRAPFRRLDRARTRAAGGHGLGLTIVDALAAAHDGDLTLEARPEGGLRVRVTLPSA